MAKTVYIALGTNISDREKNLENALQHIASLVEILKKSSIYETDPAGYENQEKFLNMAIKVESKLGPSKLLSELQEIEKTMGRVKTIKNGPRIIDLDILFYAQEIIETKNLIIPHPRLHERKFVLEPLAQIEPNLIHPKFNLSIKNLLKQYESGQNN